jgi:hypothetical protein
MKKAPRLKAPSSESFPRAELAARHVSGGHHLEESAGMVASFVLMLRPAAFELPYCVLWLGVRLIPPRRRVQCLTNSTNCFFDGAACSSAR